MKVCYIITPTKDTDHLVRCINSIYRQIGSDYYVILAESFAGNYNKELLEYLDGLDSLIRISEKAENFDEKINEAVSLIPSDSDYVIFADASTVVSPAAAQAILSCNGADLIVPAAAKRQTADYVDFSIDKPDESFLINNINEYSFQRFCFSKPLLSEILPEYMRNQYRFSMYILRKILGVGKVAVTEDICIYIENLSVKDINTHTVEDVASDGMPMIEELHSVEDARIKTAVFDKITQDIIEFAGGIDKNERLRAHELLQTVCKKIHEDILLKKLFEFKVGCEADIFLKLGYEEYNIYRERLSYHNEQSALPDIGIAEQRKLAETVYGSVNELKKEIAELKKDLISVVKNQQKPALSAKQQTGSLFLNPVTEIPNLYAQGRLGFKVMWRSFGAWLRYKFRRKK